MSAPNSSPIVGAEGSETAPPRHSTVRRGSDPGPVSRRKPTTAPEEEQGQILVMSRAHLNKGAGLEEAAVCERELEGGGVEDFEARRRPGGAGSDGDGD